MFQMRFCYDQEHVDQDNVKNIDIRCSNCGKETGLFMKNMNSNYKYIITKFIFNTMLHHTSVTLIIESN